MSEALRYGSTGDLPVGARPDSGYSIRSATGVGLEWAEPGRPEWSRDTLHTFATAEVFTVPDLAQFDDGTNRSPAERMHQAAGRLLSAAAFLPLVDSLELRYVSLPNRDGPTTVKMFVSAKTKSGVAALAGSAVESACVALPPGFRWGTPTTDSGIGRSTDSGFVIELRRQEEVIDPYWEFVVGEFGIEFFYLINDRPGDGSGWAGFWPLLAAQPTRVEISLLFAATELHPMERAALSSMLSTFELIAHPHTDFDVLGNQLEYPADLGARRALESWQERVPHLQRPLLARVAVRADPGVAPGIATALAAAIASSREPHHPQLAMWPQAPGTARDQRQAQHSFDFLEILPWGGIELWDHPAAPTLFRRMPYLTGLDQAGGMALLPVPDQYGAPGFPRARRSDGRRSTVGSPSVPDKGVVIGQLLHHGRPGGTAALPLSSLNRHALVVGSPGSGKTTTVMTLLADLWIRHRVPFLVIESVKAEYRSLRAVSGLGELAVITVGREDISPLRLNPFAPPPGVRCENQADTVLALLKVALPLVPPLPELLGQAIDDAYRRAGWHEDTTSADGLAPPTLRDLARSFDIVFQAQGYRGEAANIGAAMRVRLSSMLRGQRGRTVDTVEHTDFADILTRPTVIEMQEVQDPDDRAVLSALLLDQVRAGARRRRSTGGRLMHVTVIEEAHRLLAAGASKSGDRSTGDTARADAVTAFCEAIAELRSYGEGFLLASQSPSALAPAAIANTGTRVVHRLESGQDRDLMMHDIGAGPNENDVAARLHQGEAVIRWPEVDEPEIVVVVPVPGVDSGHDVGDDDISGHMADTAKRTRSLLPFTLCTREVCSTGCRRDVRRRGQDAAELVSGPARQVWNGADHSSAAGATAGVRAVVGLVRGAGPKVEQEIYCACAHLQATAAAFHGPPPARVRERLIAAVRSPDGSGDA